jgi:hypothetical protein
MIPLRRAWSLATVALLACGKDAGSPAPSLFIPSRYALASIDGFPLPANLVDSANTSHAVLVLRDTLVLHDDQTLRHAWAYRLPGQSTIRVTEEDGQFSFAANHPPEVVTTGLVLTGGITATKAGLTVISARTATFARHTFVYEHVSYTGP